MIAVQLHKKNVFYLEKYFDNIVFSFLFPHVKNSILFPHNEGLTQNYGTMRINWYKDHFSHLFLVFIKSICLAKNWC